MKPINHYADGGIDRATHLRNNDKWVANQLTAADTLFAPVWKTHNFFSSIDLQQPEFLTNSNVETGTADAIIFLGYLRGKTYFALDYSSHFTPPLGELGLFRDLRSVGATLPQDTGTMLAYARGMIYWHLRHRYCGECGAPTSSLQAGHLRVCTNSSCGVSCFPRTDPAVIMLVHDGDRILMGRQNQWPPGMYSVLAGFVEPGESLEGAVAREIFEEAGIEVSDITYHSSQPWPFPSSIMLGFIARAITTHIVVDHRELEDANWFTRKYLLSSPENDKFSLPRQDSIARRLVNDWLIA